MPGLFPAEITMVAKPAVLFGPFTCALEIFDVVEPVHAVKPISSPMSPELIRSANGATLLRYESNTVVLVPITPL